MLWSSVLGIAARRAAFAVTVSILAIAGAPTQSVAQRAGSLPLVSLVFTNPVEERPSQVAAFVEGMATVGWFDGANVEYAFINADDEGALAALIARNPSAIVFYAGGLGVDLAALTDTIPLVAATVPDDTLMQLVEDFDAPIINMTGRYSIRGFSGSPSYTLPVARELLPDATTVGLLINSGADHQPYVDMAADYGFTAVIAEVASADDTVAAFNAVVAQGAQVVLTPGGSRFADAGEELAAAAVAARIPTFYVSRAQNQYMPEDEPTGLYASGLIVVGQDDYDALRIAAYTVDRLLNGETPAEIKLLPAPVFMQVNLDAAEAIGLTIPDSILARSVIVGN